MWEGGSRREAWVAPGPKCPSKERGLIQRAWHPPQGLAQESDVVRCVSQKGPVAALWSKGQMGRQEFGGSATGATRVPGTQLCCGVEGRGRGQRPRVRGAGEAWGCLGSGSGVVRTRPGVLAPGAAGRSALSRPEVGFQEHGGRLSTLKVWAAQGLCWMGPNLPSGILQMLSRTAVKATPMTSFASHKCP